MRNVIAGGAALLISAAPSGALAQKAPRTPVVLAETDRQVPNGRVVHLALRQTEIATSIDIGRVAKYNYVYYNGLWTPFLGDVDEDMHDMLRKAQHDKAEAIAAPLRNALAGFDVDSIALAATSTALAKLEWFRPETVTLARDTETEARVAFLASSNASQFAIIRYRYELSPDFSQIRVVAEITLMRRRHAGDRGSDQLTPIYRQRILSAVQLRTRSFEPIENAASWGAEGGKLAKAALTAAFSRLETLLPYALGLDQAEVDTLLDKRHEKAFAAGFYGALIGRDAADRDDVLIWADGLIQVQSIP